MTANSSSRAALEHSPTAHCLVEGETVTYANPAFGRLLDVDLDSIEGTRFPEYVADADRDRVVDALDELTDGPGTDEGPTAGDGGPVSVQFRLAGDGRDERTVASEWAVNGGDPGGESGVSLVGSLRDVSDRVARERDLERESEMLASLLDNIPMSIYFKDRLSRHERVSRHLACRDEGRCITNAEGKMHPHHEDVIGKTDWDVYGPEVAEGAVAEDRRVMEEEEPMFNEVTESTTNLGETFFSSTTKAPRYDDEGNVVGIVGVTMDVTDRMTYERELERQNDRLEEFADVLAHDLRNPLTVATGHVELLGERYDDPSIDAVDESLERIATLVSEIRSFAVEGRTVESPAAVDLAAAARDAWESVDTGDADLAVTATHTVRADPDRLRRLLENVYRNAVEHGRSDGDADPDGAVSVTVGDLDDGFYVADDGPGIPDEHKDDVFERGFSTGSESTGFGLAIVRNIAGAHDWTVRATDSAGGGARVEFSDVVRVEADVGEADSSDESHDEAE